VTAAELDRIERELEVSRVELEDLQRRTRVIEVETRSWVPQPVRQAQQTRGAGLGLLLGFGGMVLLRLVVYVIGRM
jgi:hypothetical protein